MLVRPRLFRGLKPNFERFIEGLCFYRFALSGFRSACRSDCNHPDFTLRPAIFISISLANQYIAVTLIYSLIYSFIIVYIRQHLDNLNSFLTASKLKKLTFLSPEPRVSAPYQFSFPQFSRRCSSAVLDLPWFWAQTLCNSEEISQSPF